MVSTFIVYLACIKGICHQAYLILIKNLESCWSHDKCWKILIDLGCIFFVVWIFSLVCLRFVVVWWNVCSALSLDKWWSLGVNSRVSQLQGIPAVFWDSICVYIYFFLLYFLWFFLSFLFEIEPFKGFDLAADFSNITNYLSSTINTQKKKWWRHCHFR